MKEIQRFAIDNIYCSPTQDRQFAFEMRRVNKPSQPYKSVFTIFNALKNLPDTTSYFHVFTLGNLPPKLLNMLYQQQGWFKDVWVNVSEDMALRNYIVKVYNEDGKVFPRQHLFYSFIDQNSLLIAMRVGPEITPAYGVESFKYMHVYSNAFFQSTYFQTNNTRIGIDYRYECVYNNVNKVNLQTYVSQMRANGGDVFIYVDGMYTDEITLNIPDGAYVEIVYDQSIKSVERFNISTLRTFDSLLDNKLKYMIYRTNRSPYIDYNDDTELYIQQTSGLVKKGLHFYKHRDYVMRNVTDKDFSLVSSYVNNTAQALSTQVSGSLSDKQIVLYMRHSARQMQLKYSSTKLHELYKLPDDVQKDVISNHNYSLDIFRAEQLENSYYFKVAGATKVSEITEFLASSAVGYNGISYHYGDALIADPTNLTVRVSELYQGQSIAYEYSADGKYMGMYPTYGELYTKTSPAVAYVEFQAGYVPPYMPPLLDNDSPPYTLLYPDDDYVVYAAYHDGVNRQSSWDDITSTAYVIKTGNTLTMNLPVGQKARVLYLKQVNVGQTTVDLDSGVLEFNLTERIDKGTGLAYYPADVAPTSLAVYMNGNRLAHGIDMHLDFPRAYITSKKYIDYTKPEQEITFRMTGYTTDKTRINNLDVVGFVNNGALTRNRYYDMRDDRVCCVFVDGKVKDKSTLRFSETDNTVRLTDPSNGMPYTVSEHIIPVKAMTGVSTYELFATNHLKDKKISEFFNLIFPEPNLNQFNAIPTAHYMYSPVISKMLVDILTGVIPSTTYTTPYDDLTILNLFDNRYSKEMKVDPVRMGFQSVLVEIHPHLGNTPVNLTLHQYRFMQNAVRLLTNNKMDQVNLSGYLSISV